MKRLYILDEAGEPEEATDVVAWGKWFEAADSRRVVAQTNIGAARVSTVFLGMDHNFYGGVPVLWETMIFDCPSLDGYQERYATQDSAKAGHEVAVGMTRKAMEEP